MIHNNGANGTSIDLSRLTNLGLEPPPNDWEILSPMAQMMAGLGGRTAPSAPGGLMPPQNDGLVLTTVAPACRQDYTKDGGVITVTPPPSVQRQENQKGIANVCGDWKDADVFGK